MEQVNKHEISILCVDDNQEIRELLQVIVARLGHNSVTAMDGLDALGQLKDNTFDIVITDLKMPRMDGEETFDELRRIDDTVPVIVTTGFGGQQCAERLCALGLAGFVQKPYQSHSLAEKLREALGDGPAPSPVEARGRAPSRPSRT